MSVVFVRVCTGFFGFVFFLEIPGAHAELLIEQSSAIRRRCDTYGIANFIDFVFSVLQHSVSPFQPDQPVKIHD